MFRSFITVIVVPLVAVRGFWFSYGTFTPLNPPANLVDSVRVESSVRASDGALQGIATCEFPELRPLSDGVAWVTLLLGATAHLGSHGHEAVGSEDEVRWGSACPHVALHVIDDPRESEEHRDYRDECHSAPARVVAGAPAEPEREPDEPDRHHHHEEDV
ncbi:MAG: hypothetical protein HYT39_02380 [Candidatus Sungbacteria bacterium]|nr:hypothetical protein [Candidatus Sungbacteria bacterium]